MIPASKKAKRTSNPIRNIVDNLNPPQNHPKKLLNLALGDPTVHGNLFAPDVLNDAITNLLARGTANGYMPSTGMVAARKAIAAYHSTPAFPISEDDVMITSGCSGAVELALSVLVNEGDNVLVPKPCFPLYQVITESLGGHVKYYPLKAESNWECDLEAMDKAVDSKTKAIVINNPSNPCGSNFSVEHLVGIAAVARKHGLPIIADEIYGKCVFNGVFHPMHHHSGDVPVITLSGLAKEFIVPGWRVGWLLVHDKQSGRMAEVKAGLKSLTQLILGANSLIQAALPRLLTPAPDSKDAQDLRAFSSRYMSILRENAKLCVEETSTCPELTVIQPEGAMYTMVRVELDRLQDVTDDADFARKLLAEENVVLLPGQCFSMAGFVRLVICPPPETIKDALKRMKEFCLRHRKAGLTEEEEPEALPTKRPFEADKSNASSEAAIALESKKVKHA